MAEEMASSAGQIHPIIEVDEEVGIVCKHGISDITTVGK